MKILTVSAHADDAEAALGGTINRFLENKRNEIFYIAFSIAEESIPVGFEKDAVARECIESTKVLGILQKNVFIERYPVRRLSNFRQEILDKLVSLRKDIKPDMVFIPSTEDIHQDHDVVCKEALRAFQRSSSIYGYDFPWNVIYTSRLNLFYEISKKNLEKKIMALQCYKSQLCKRNNCLTPEYIKSLALIRGNMVDVKFAEAFEMIREFRRL